MVIIIIQLTDEIFITADEFQYVLIKTVKNPTPKHPHDILGYFDTLESVGKALAKRSSREMVQNTDMTLKEACTAFAKLEQHITNTIEDYLKGI